VPDNAKGRGGHSVPFRSFPVFSRRSAWLFACAGLLAGLGSLAGGCGGNSDESRIFGDKLKISYLGLTCEAPIFAAYEMGFFKEEGLDVELCKTDWDSLRDGLGLGRFDATHHLTMFLLKPIEMGMDIYLTGGIHSGCLRLQAGVKTDIHKLEHFKGKKVAISSMGNPPLMFSSRALSRQGMDTQRDIEWLVYPNDAMELALEQGQIDGVASAEPIGTILLSRNKVRSICDQATDPPFNTEYCCVTVVNGELARKNPEKAAKATRAMLKGALWVQTNQTAAARLAVEKKYTSASVEINAQAISVLNYHPGVTKAKKDLLAAAVDMKAFGYLKRDTDPERLVEKAWRDLPGVTDEWVSGLKVDKIAGGGRPPRMSLAAFAALFDDPRMCREFRFCPDDCAP
jgi:NitT/TauT family transport system substrate-binding protein